MCPHGAFQRNVELEYERNKERYQFLRWGQTAFDQFKVVPPGTGIVHQVNIEYLAPVVVRRPENGMQIAFPDTVDAGLRVGKLGRSSVRYEIELGREGEPGALAEGWFVHVFVDRGTRRPVEIPPQLRGSLERLQVAA